MNKSYILWAIGILIVAGFGYQHFMTGDSDTKMMETNETAMRDADRVNDMKADVSSTSMKEDMMKDKAMTGEGVLFKAGHLSLDVDGKMSPLSTDYTFKNGLKVMMSGKVIKTDGTSFMLKEGESVWQDGSVMNDSTIDATGTGIMKGDTMMIHDSMMAKMGSYLPYDPAKLTMAKDGHVVLFFHASWCPTCRALDKDITAHIKDIPANLTVFDVDYDTSAELKKKYGVTYQHTLVEVDASGNMIKKWAGSPTLSALVSEVK